MIKLFREAIGMQSGGTDHIPEDVRKKIEIFAKCYVVKKKVSLREDLQYCVEYGYSLSLPTIQAQEERIRVLEEALNEIVQMKRLPGETTDTYAFNRNWHIATNALTPKTNNL